MSFGNVTFVILGVRPVGLVQWSGYGFDRQPTGEQQCCHALHDVGKTVEALGKSDARQSQKHHRQLLF